MTLQDLASVITELALCSDMEILLAWNNDFLDNEVSIISKRKVYDHGSTYLEKNTHASYEAAIEQLISKHSLYKYVIISMNQDNFNKLKGKV